MTYTTFPTDATLTAVLAQMAPGSGPMGHGGGMWGASGAMGTGWWGLLGPVLLLLFLVGLVVVLSRSDLFGDSRDDALEELRLAYARGDLSDEEYERRRVRLS